MHFPANPVLRFRRRTTTLLENASAPGFHDDAIRWPDKCQDLQEVGNGKGYASLSRCEIAARDMEENGAAGMG
jgi:hypothetical protein